MRPCVCVCHTRRTEVCVMRVRLKYQVEAGPDWIPSRSGSGPEPGLWEALVYSLYRPLHSSLAHVFCALPLPHTLKHAQAVSESEWEERFRYCLNGRIHIHKVVKIPILASILVNTVGYVLSLRIQPRKNMQNSCVSCMTTCRSGSTENFQWKMGRVRKIQGLQLS